MPINANKPERWKTDIINSVDFYNTWFMQFAPQTFRDARKVITNQVNDAIKNTADLTLLTPELLKQHPSTLSMLRMATAPPIARDRLSGLAYVSRTIINRMEIDGKLPTRIVEADLNVILTRILDIIARLLDRDIFPWLEHAIAPTEQERERASTIVADRLTGATADPIIRNAQEQRQLKAIGDFLTKRGYKVARFPQNLPLREMKPGTYTFRHNVVVGMHRQVNVPIDVIIQPQMPLADQLPILIEAKSAGDFTNTNKRRKEEATKMRQLRETYGDTITYVLFLNGYFDSGYLGYEAAEGIDWVWEHRIDDLLELGT